MFIGRYQCFHKGHMKIFDKFLSENKPILVAIRDVNEEFISPDQVKKLIEKVYSGNNLVKVIIIPDICSVNFGRDVGYEINEIEVEEDIKKISGTLIRKLIKENDSSWKIYIDERIQDDFQKLFSI